MKLYETPNVETSTVVCNMCTHADTCMHIHITSVNIHISTEMYM